MRLRQAKRLERSGHTPRTHTVQRCVSHALRGCVAPLAPYEAQALQALKVGRLHLGGGVCQQRVALD